MEQVWTLFTTCWLRAKCVYWMYILMLYMAHRPKLKKNVHTHDGGQGERIGATSFGWHSGRLTSPSANSTFGQMPPQREGLCPDEEDFEDMIYSAESMEAQHGHMFDKVIVNGDVAVAFRELKADLQQLEEAHVRWIPADWLCPSPTKQLINSTRGCGITRAAAV
ncbi:uncharacterized protein LOC144202121 [Stigmatopora nigra]